MEQLASGAAKALNSLWGGLAGVAKGTLTAGHSLASKVNHCPLCPHTHQADIVTGM
jgi:hypothetical protein